MKAEESNRFFELLDKLRASLDDPDEQLVHQTFEIPKRLMAEIDALEKSGELDLGAAEERRFRIQTTALFTAYKRVLNCWNTRDKLDEVFARYSRHGSQHVKRKENLLRTEVLNSLRLFVASCNIAVHVESC